MYLILINPTILCINFCLQAMNLNLTIVSLAALLSSVGESCAHVIARTILGGNSFFLLENMHVWFPVTICFPFFVLVFQFILGNMHQELIGPFLKKNMVC